MNIRTFIERPVLASVVAIMIVVAGLAAMRELPIEQYPEIVPPQVNVTALLPGASADTIANTVAAPLEQAVNGIENGLYVQSSNANGQMSLSVTFDVGTDPDKATIDVNNRVQAAMAKLPEETRRLGVTVEKNSNAILLAVFAFSPDNSRDPVFVSNYALFNIVDELQRIPGVGRAMLFGARDYSMRVWLKPEQLARFGLSPADVANAIREQNAQYAAGSIGQEPMSEAAPFTYNITTRGRLSSPEQFGEIILRANSHGGALRLKDVARIELGAQDYSLNATYDGKTGVGIGIFLAPGANALETSQAIHETMQRLEKKFPAGLAWEIPFDTSEYVRVSIEEVLKTFAEALLLVVLVVYLFLQSWRPALIPIMAIPVSIIGTFAGLYLMGFSINLLTLFAMVLSIGIVVDDAIVVLENVERIMHEQGKSAKEAAIQSMDEVASPIIAIVLVLSAVFIPVGFLSGLTGVMYAQFAITIAVSVIISGIVALTLTPAMCALLLEGQSRSEPTGFFRWFNVKFDFLRDRFVGWSSALLRRTMLGVTLFVVLAIVGGSLLWKLPNALVPDEDAGWIMAAPILPAAASLDRTRAVSDDITNIIGQQETVEHVVAFTGYDFLSNSLKTSTGIVFIPLKDWSERPREDQDARNIVGPFMGMMGGNRDAFVLFMNPPPIFGISVTGGFEMFIQQRGETDPAALAEVVQKVTAEANKRQDMFMQVFSTFDANVPQYRADVNIEKAKMLGINVDDLYATLQSTFGSMYVNDFTIGGRPFRVTMQADERYRSRPEDLRYVYVKTRDGSQVPVESVVTITRVSGPELLERLNMFTSARVMGTPLPGVSSGDAIRTMEQIVQDVAGDEYSVGWTGAAFHELRSGNTAPLMYMLGLLMVFLILAAQYERWTMPLAVVTAVPFALLGAVLAVYARNIFDMGAWIFGMTVLGNPGGPPPPQLANDVYFQVGMLTLIGLAAKNAILIVEFAAMRYREGMDAAQAAVEGMRLRFRPIVMTSIAFISGCIPLALASGAGSASRHSIGTAVIGGMLAATFIATLFVPLFYWLIEHWRERAGGAPMRSRGPVPHNAD
ncbi:MAG: efflux RND transporter permease subunit [Pseudomonadota bacterium]